MNRAFAVLGLLVPLFAIPAFAPTAGQAQSTPETPTHELARRVLEAGLDPEECYQVRDVRLGREDARVYLTEGIIVFGKEVGGTRLSAIFSGEVEGGDGEVLLLPPYRSERLSLATFAGAPNLDEHFRTAVMLFTDNTYAEIMKSITARGAKKRPERGALLAENWDPVVRNLSSSFNIRIVRDLLGDSRPTNGFFYAAMVGQKLGNFDFLFDPRAPEQINLGQVVVRYEQAYFDLWTRFAGRSFRTGQRTAPPEDVVVGNYKIDATLERDLKMRVTTVASATVSADGRRALSFDISPQMHIDEVRIDGEPAEVFQPNSLRASLIRGDINTTFLVIPAKPLQPNREYQIEFKHSGSVITDAGNGVYFVGARGCWYPNRFPQFARYDLIFRYPEDLDLVATGKTIEQSTENGWRVAHHRIDTPVRMAGFNLGQFEHAGVTRGGYTVDVYANRTVEAALARPQQRMIVVPGPPLGPPGDRRWTVDLSPFPTEPPKVKPSEHLEQLAVEIASGLEFMASYYGPPVLKVLTVSPIPGTFGQGFPGLIYLSTLAYLDPKFRPPAVQTEMQQMFYSDIMHAHETAHQWWGNLVASSGPEDDWIMEALANYSALLYLEKRRGSRALDQVLAEYKSHLLAKAPSGQTLESAGPILWGPRLNASQTPQAWRTIMYEKGSWIIHMLRRRLGDDKFLAMLTDLRNRYQYRTLTTDDFRKTAAAALPPNSFDANLESFFEQWVYSTGIPALKLTSSVQGKGLQIRITGAVTQSDVADDFSTFVPVEIQVAKGKPIVQWVRTASEPVTFSVALKQAPTRVVLDPANSVLRK